MKRRATDRRWIHGSLVVVVLASACVLFATAGVLAEERLDLGPGGSNWIPRDVDLDDLWPTYVWDADALVAALVGPDVAVANAELVAAAVATGTFTGGTDIIDFESGVILSTGDIMSVVGPNLADDTSTDNGLPGDLDLNALIPGYITYDATILEFDFMCENLLEFTFQYVFTSEEYNEWVFSEFNDVFAFFLNGNLVGNNIAVVPNFCNAPGIPVAINNVNCEDPYNPPSGLNCDCYRNNDLDDGGGTIDTEMDGLTYVFYATSEILPGWNHIKLAIADAGDGVWDSNVFIKGESFECEAPVQYGACCDGANCMYITLEECVAGQYQPGWMGAEVPCDPNPCPAPVESFSWGVIKSLYR